MLRFLVALMREGAPSVCWGIVQFVYDLKKSAPRKVLSGIYADKERRVPEHKRSAYNVSLLENENDAQEDFDSGLIARDVRLAGDMGWRSIRSERGYISSQRQL